MNPHELRRLMECCRPDLRDLTAQEAAELARAWQQDPELHRQWLAIRAWDASLGEALHCTPVPDGLEERLLAAVTRATTAVDRPADPLRDAGEPASRGARAGRRQWIASAAAACLLATSAVLALAFWLVRSRDTLTAAQVVNEARQWLGQLEAQAWQTGSPPIRTFPPTTNVRVEVVAWQPWTTGLGAAGLVYQAAVPPDRTTALLFVIPTRLGSHLPALPPARPDATTENLCIGVWKADGVLYVLIVPGREDNYRRALVTPTFA